MASALSSLMKLTSSVSLSQNIRTCLHKKGKNHEEDVALSIFVL